jgi:hypothetical protein
MNNAEACERILAENIADVATELRLIDVANMIAFVQSQKSAAIEDLVNSAAELYFQNGALRYAWCADLDIAWDAFPSVSLNLEFRWSGVTAFFRLRLDSAYAGVDLQHLAFDDEALDATPCERFALAMADARVAPPRRARNDLARGLGF